MDLDQLNDSQKEALEQYMTIMETEDMEAALIKLTSHDFDVQATIQSSFEETNTESTSESRNVSSVGSSSTSNVRSSSSNTRTNINPNRANNNTFWSYLTIPVYLISRVLLNILYLPLYLYKSFKTIGYTQPQPDPNQPAVPYKDRFEEEFGEVHPEFLRGTYAQALEKAKNELKFLVVVLHSDSARDTVRFCTEILASPFLLDFFRENNILCWAGDIKYTEGYQVSNTLQARNYPFMGVICLQKRPNQSDSGKMLVVDRIEGFHDIETVIQKITHQMERCQPYLEQIKADRFERESSRSIREEQDRAYLESLRQDQEKERKARQEKERVERENHEQQLAALEALEITKRRIIYRKQLKDSLPPEPAATEKNIAKIQFRLPDNNRVVRRFSANDTIQTLYNYVETLQTEPEEDQIELNSELPSNYVHETKFVIVSPFPRVQYEPSETTLESCKGLWPSTSLVVEPVDPVDL
ncbi:UBX-domain-containing protein [Conidiobolus coronatus NRRL 28638]|uniref:UBX-domain-containing protein n=1 Tax=Conidiobolus coronatus (strain ATCC 28846 / CBS 209.66 / NRRL 28638) TaxID=796925 RepID=A0A137P6C4_CONC2|nr:UBX-domain-containing protein [Conidiobolus coronatus NRRL 28638]|eukprot:KXN70556.1 UBX-domain-containing protein [Conidiobolus coronatus NRRL 28638]